MTGFHQTLTEVDQRIQRILAVRKQRKGEKLDPLWLGPYVINRDVGKGLYELCDMKGKVVKKKANINRLKVYVRRHEGTASRCFRQPNTAT